MKLCRKFIFFILAYGYLISSAIFATTQSTEEISAFLDLMNEQLPAVIDESPELTGQFSKVQILEDGGPSFINSVYLISLKNGQELIIKIGNPVWQGKKTLNEVSALKFLKTNTTIPVPNVLIYESNANRSSIKNEFIIMPRVPGKPLNKEIDRIYKDKVLYHKILDQLACNLAELKSFHFSHLGNFIYSDKNKLEIGGIVDFANYEIETPCATYGEYAKHALNFYVKEMEILLSKKKEDSELYIKYIPILKDLLINHDFDFLNNQDSFVFSHQDFVMKNILVDGDKITAILDWEWCGSALIENESMTGLDFLFSEEDRIYFSRALDNLGVINFFTPPPSQRELFYRFLGNVYTLVAFREWKEGKLEHTAKFLSQKLEQRKIRNDPDFDMELFISTITDDLDQSIIKFKELSHKHSH